MVIFSRGVGRRFKGAAEHFTWQKVKLQNMTRTAKSNAVS